MANRGKKKPRKRLRAQPEPGEKDLKKESDIKMDEPRVLEENERRARL